MRNMPFPLDNATREIAVSRSALPECLHVPIAAVDESAITTYIGEIEEILADGSPRRALLVRTKEPPSIDTALLHDMSQLVRQQTLSLPRVRRVLGRAEHDVAPYRVGPRLHGARSACRFT